MARSPVAYFTAETLAQQEVEQYGQIFFAGYKQAFAAVSTPIGSVMLAQVKRDLDTLLSNEADRSLKAIQYVRDACGITATTRDAAELRRLPQQKLVAELDLFVAQLKRKLFQETSRSRTGACLRVVLIRLAPAMGRVSMVAVFVSASRPLLDREDVEIQLESRDNAHRLRGLHFAYMAAC